ncbi:MAG: deoxyribodipyrimidine photo-lyase [Pseudomonadota bacterium]
MTQKTAPKTAIVWFRRDIRLSDNPALHAACKDGYNIIPLYILDDENPPKDEKLGGAHRVWLHHSLKSLDNDLSNHLVLQKGDAKKIIPDLVKKTNADAVFWNRCYEPWRIDRDKEIKSNLKDNDIHVETFNGSLLWEPWHIKNQSGAFYKVFTPFYRKGCLQADPPREPLDKPTKISFGNTKDIGVSLDDFALLPDKEGEWHEHLISQWDTGESGAQKRLKDFLDDGLNGYKDGRNHPSWNNVSRLSPYLNFGEISPNQAWYAAQERGTAEGWEKDRDHFLSELGWREFSYNLLYHFPKLKWDNMQEKFNDFPWNDQDNDQLENWRRGRTGYPIVDAGMRQLYETGYMHNRVRMIVGSFLVKNMLTHWHKGEEWFWDTLVDGDPASNTASWQWIAGCGADAAPYFRIFNPILQSKKFDEKGEYIRRFVPELKEVPDEHIHAPWEAPQGILEMAGITLGDTYPQPMMDHSDARDKAMEAYQVIKKVA